MASKHSELGAPQLTGEDWTGRTSARYAMALEGHVGGHQRDVGVSRERVSGAKGDADARCYLYEIASAPFAPALTHAPYQP